MHTFDRAFDIVLGVEGGYVNDSDDPGGETNFGITKRMYPEEDIKNMTVERARVIYYRDYWKLCGAEHLTWPMALYVFDCAVNSGPAKARSFIAEAPTPDAYLARREQYYRDIVAARPVSRKYLKGWLDRLKTLRRRGLQ